MAIPRIAITPGEPAGIGPDVVLAAAQRQWAAQLVAICDANLMRERADELGLNIHITAFDPQQPAGQTMASAGSKLLGTPYEEKTLESGKGEVLVVNLRGLDCTTFVENALKFSTTLVRVSALL